jgi:hypothetical protein
MPFMDTRTYREREKRWREEANSKPEGAERDACLSLANSYANLISIIERIEQGGKVQAGRTIAEV